MENPDTVSDREAEFTVQIPEAAFISNFTMIIDGEFFQAEIKGKRQWGKKGFSKMENQVILSKTCIVDQLSKVMCNRSSPELFESGFFLLISCPKFSSFLWKKQNKTRRNFLEFVRNVRRIVYWCGVHLAWPIWNLYPRNSGPVCFQICAIHIWQKSVFCLRNANKICSIRKLRNLKESWGKQIWIKRARLYKRAKSTFLEFVPFLLFLPHGILASFSVQFSDDVGCLKRPCFVRDKNW